MHIEPNTNIRLIKQCRLVNNYEHTIYFNSPSEQEAYFKSLPGVPFTKQSYQRYSSGVLTVKAPMSAIYECNYMMFKNESFEDKWFYAFVNKVEYVNNVTCRVYYEIDIMQTWHFNYYMCECFVEREHSRTDNIGDNLVHEDIYFGPYVYGDEVTPVDENGFNMDDLSVVIMYNPDLLDLTGKIIELGYDVPTYERQVYSGVYQGVNFVAVPMTSYNADFIHGLIADIDFTSFGGFLSAFIMPTMFLPMNPSEYNEYNTEIYFEVPRNTDFKGYTPNNNKLFTYPYTCANLTSHRNEGNDFAFEFFNYPVKDGAAFVAMGNMCANPSSLACPINYKSNEMGLEHAVTIPSYPICTWGSEGVTEWINNNLFKGLAGVGGNMVASALSPVGSVAGAALRGTIEGAIGLARAEFDPGSVHGSVDGDILIGTYTGRLISARVKHITRYYAEIVDEYFNKFGYATNRVKIPNRNVRPYWTYVKTVGCLIKQHEIRGIPADDMASICGVYDRGITFWTPEATIGDYSNQINSPVSEVNE